MRQELPRVFNARRVFGWGRMQSLDRTGAVMFEEAQRQLASLLAEIERVIPGHQVDEARLLLEIKMQYIAPTERPQV